MSDRPSKERVRTWLNRRAEDWKKDHKPLPSQKDIRRQLGIDLMDALRKRPKR